LNGKNAARKLYRNDGNWNFTDVTVAEGLNESNKGSYDSAWADIDRDGDQDLIATTDSNSDERVFISDASGNGNNWLYVELTGTSDNTTAIGASIYATINDGTAQERTLRREANTNAGTFNQSDLPVHFGLGSAGVIDKLRIVWPDGTVQYILNVSVDQYLAVNIADIIAGDLDGDGFVGINDLNIILSAWNQNVPPADALADPSGDGFVGIDDLNFVLGNWNAGTPPGEGAAIPEPGTLVVMGLGGLVVLRRKH
jgi:enediyne biosynthesis protein E4